MRGSGSAAAIRRERAEANGNGKNGMNDGEIFGLVDPVCAKLFGFSACDRVKGISSKGSVSRGQEFFKRIQRRETQKPETFPFDFPPF